MVPTPGSSSPCAEGRLASDPKLPLCCCVRMICEKEPHCMLQRCVHVSCAVKNFGRSMRQEKRHVNAVLFVSYQNQGHLSELMPVNWVTVEAVEMWWKLPNKRTTTMGRAQFISFKTAGIGSSWCHLSTLKKTMEVCTRYSIYWYVALFLCCQITIFPVRTGRVFCFFKRTPLWAYWRLSCMLLRLPGSHTNSSQLTLCVQKWV